MAEDTIDHALVIAQLEHVVSATMDLRIHGYHKNAATFGDLAEYGSDAPELLTMIKNNPDDGIKFHESFNITPAHVKWAVQEEMARTLEDFLTRRSRCLILDTRTTVAIAENVARTMAQSLNKGRGWIKTQVKEFKAMAANYLPH
jgi:glycerol-3-phosphate dehydrogenase